MLETLDLARLRLVDGEALAAPAAPPPPGHAVAPRLGHYLPAIYLAAAPAADTVTTDLGRVTAPRPELMPAEPTRWARLEPGSRDRELAPGLEARVHDPLWLLGRQWQFGEFAASDGGSAIVAQVSASVAPLTKLRPGRPGRRRRGSANYVVPADAAGDARRGRRHPRRADRADARPRRAAFRAPAGRAQPRPVRRRLPHRVSDRGDAGPAPTRRAGASWPLVAGRAIDGEKLLPATSRSSLRATPPALPAAPAIAAADAAAVLAAAQAWVAWADALVFTPSGGARRPGCRTASSTRSAATSPDGITLEADEYADGRLDWHTFTATGTPATPPAGRTTLGPLTVVPTAVTYPGMPASRLWEFEDGRVNFGAVEAQPEDLGRMLLAGFALVYGANWLLVPLEVPVGDPRPDHAPRRPRHVRAHDHRRPDRSGRRLGDVRPLARGRPARRRAADRARARREPAGPRRRGGAAAARRGREPRVGGRAHRRGRGRAAGRPGAGRATKRSPLAPPSARPPDTLPYRLRTDPPPHWFPLLPQRAQPTDPSMTFRLGALPRVTAGRARRRRCARAAASCQPMAGTRPGHAARGRGPARGRPRHARLPARALDRRHHATSGSAGARRSAAARAPAACASTPPTTRLT